MWPSQCKLNIVKKGSNVDKYKCLQNPYTVSPKLFGQ